MRRTSLSTCVCAAVVLLSGGYACASSNSGSPPDHAVPAARSPNLITQAEIEESGTSTALQVVQRLRPNFLSTRGSSSRKGADIGVVVYANGTKLGGTSTLGDIPTQDVKQIEYLDGSAATQRFGTGHSHGAILVTRK